MHALTISKGWGPSASRVYTIALRRPRRPAAALAARRGRPRGGRDAFGCTGPSRAARGRVAGPSRPARAGAPREGPRLPRKRGRRPEPFHRAVPCAQAAADCRGCSARWGSKARPKLPFPDLASLTCLSREMSTVLTPVMSKFRRFSSDLRSMTRRSVIFLHSA